MAEQGLTINNYQAELCKITECFTCITNFKYPDRWLNKIKCLFQRFRLIIKVLRAPW